MFEEKNPKTEDVRNYQKGITIPSPLHYSKGQYADLTSTRYPKPKHRVFVSQARQLMQRPHQNNCPNRSQTVSSARPSRVRVPILSKTNMGARQGGVPTGQNVPLNQLHNNISLGLIGLQLFKRSVVQACKGVLRSDAGRTFITTS